MIEFEDQLRSALGRQPAPPDFAMQVLARAARLDRPAVKRWQPWLAGSLAASLWWGAWEWPITSSAAKCNRRAPRAAK